MRIRGTVTIMGRLTSRKAAKICQPIQIGHWFARDGYNARIWLRLFLGNYS